jgi:hypothetical protein
VTTKNVEKPGRPVWIGWLRRAAIALLGLYAI